MKAGKFMKKLKTASMGAAMADMALLLLVFFMASTTTEPPKGVEVELPKAQTEGAEQDSLYISISNKGEIYFDGSNISLSDLYDRLAMRQGEKDRIVAVTADKSLPYKTIADVLDVLKKRDFLNIVFMAEEQKKLIE
ncbi:MAG: biopolymer transporter ExbD [Spirochaetia bacterium]|nr:biopolymer transporter ExbD [Spirochaetia bacterium]